MTTPDEPSSKNPRIDLFLSRLTGKSREIQIASGLCMTCDGEAKEFKDDLSRKEYGISGMCQACQDATFG
tara:strand:- start:853 stop:1062 length:210 start_codon:yes stop_codon:yes gene_type:complete